MAHKRQDGLRSQIGQFSMVPAWLLERCRDARAIHLYAVIGRYANREGVAWPTRELLAADLDVSLPSIARSLKLLRDLGAVKTRLRHRQSDGAVVGMDYLLVQIDPAVASTDGRIGHQVTRDTKVAVTHRVTGDTKETERHQVTSDTKDDRLRITGDRSFESPVINAYIGRTRSNELDPEEERERASGAQPSLLSIQVAIPSPEDLRQLWNDTTTLPLPRCVALTASRRRQAATRIGERSFDEWRTVMQRIEGSSFCRGDNDRGWRASFTWLIQSGDPGMKVLEGLYDNRPKAERPFTGKELDHARQVLHAWGYCRHDPRCDDAQACIATIVRHRRGTAA